MRTRTFLFGCVVLFLAGGPAGVSQSRVIAADDNVVLQWNAEVLQAIRTARFSPVFAARALAVVHTCMYDAWAAFDDAAAGAHWTTSLRQPVDARTDANKAEAISFAAHAALVDLFPSQKAAFDARLTALGFTAPGEPGTLGLSACDAVLTFRHQDGSNQLGDLNPGAYSDYTGYMPLNTADVLADPNHWQPLATAAGPQTFLAPHWGRVTPFSTVAFDAIRPEPPPEYPHGTYRKEANKILHLSATLDDKTKMIAEYWADGPATETPPGHWNLFAQFVSRRDTHTLDEDVRMFFLLGNAMMDASIAVWECKRHYDFARPITAIRFLYAGSPVRAWAGPGQGTRLIDGSEFRSYIATPPFAEYVSGHSTFSAAAAEVLEWVTGSDAFGGSVSFAPGSSTIEPGVTPRRAVTLTWETFTDAAQQAGLSRRLGGIHFESGDLAGRKLGGRIAALVVARGQELFGR